ncbi:major pollen allergen Aln g 1-like [Phoenix dactylifera]|uniref:Major pollen allergen Aln g 1-like n=1 Tax=Phoenix dactylifera TaxID=42345 RepID=A0A8B7CBK0_PHODC|nr:major pollen allergen Aln g 1-like [Phoenix dactylifera]
MVAGSITEVCSSTVALERLWKAGVLDADKLMPQIAPQFISSIEVLEGDGGVGTVRKYTFTEAVKGPVNFLKERVEALDSENKIFEYSVIEGGLIGLRLKLCSYELKFELGSDGSSVGKLTLKYETLDDTDLGEEEKGMLMEGPLGIMKAVEGFLLANPDAYT